MTSEKRGGTPGFFLSLSKEEIELRKKWLQLGERDENILTSELDQLVSPRADQLMDVMYKHFLAFAETRSFFEDPQVLNRAKSAQASYFRRLTKGDYNEEYVQDRLRVGYTHHRIDLDPKWYIGAYNQALLWLLPAVIESCKDKPQKLAEVFAALMKIIFFDMGLAIESYIGSKEFAIRQHRDAINELVTEKRVTKNILESAPIGIVSLNHDLTCLECNDEFVQILDLPHRQEVIGRELQDFAPQLNADVFREVLSSGQPCRRSAESLGFSSSGAIAESYWDWAAWPVKDDSGKSSGLVAMFANATDRVMLQQQREDFVATLTHDLKTPVLATNRAVQFLLEGDFGPISDEQKDVLETISQSNSALYSLVQTLLDVYRFDSGVKEMHARDCNLAAVITHMVTECMPLAQEKGVELKAILPGDAKDVQCDEDEIRRVVQNLIDNSLKFTAGGGSITVSMDQGNGKTVVKVADTGKGISDENKPKLFQRFWQAGSTGRHYASTGLGLYLCRRIVEGHGGKIWCESALGRGSTFYFEI
jgi:signal transduction histidine kinase